MKIVWKIFRVCVEFVACIYVAAIPVVLVPNALNLRFPENTEVSLVLGLTIALVIALEFLWWKLKNKKHVKPIEAKSVPKPQPAKTLQVSAPPRPTGQSTYVMLNPKACLSAKNYVMLDTETTGFSSTTDRVIEIGMIKCVDDKPVDSFTTFVNPDMHIPSNISRLTGITDVDVKDAPQFHEIAQQIIDFIGDLPVVAHNAHFDARMLCSEFDYMGLNVILKVIDTLTMARKAFPHFKSHKLRTLIHELGLTDHEQQHRALDDTEVGHQLYLRCKDKLSSTVK